MENRINNIIKETLGVSDDQVVKNLAMPEVDAWDSLTHMNLIVALEESFQIELSGDDIAEMISFDAIRTMIKKYT